MLPVSRLNGQRCSLRCGFLLAPDRLITVVSDKLHFLPDATLGFFLHNNVITMLTVM